MGEHVSVFFLFCISGAVVGVAFATFIIGLVIGVAMFFVFNRLRTKQHDEIEMHLTKQSH